MTVPSEIARSGPYLGNGVTSSFAYGFRILADTHLRVTTVDGAGIESVLTLGADYSVTGVGNALGGSVILTAPLAVGLQLVITRDVPATQEVDLENQGAFLAEVIEAALDKAIMLIQQEGERSDRTVTLPVTSDGVSTSLPGAVANAVLGWNADGSALENKTPNDGTVLPALLGSLTTAEITQILNINATTISAAQWGFLGALTGPPPDETAVAITGGTIDGVTITGGTIDGTVIGGSTPAAGSFTNVTFDGLLTRTADIDALALTARLRNQSAGASASTRLSLGNDSEADDFRIDLNGSGNTSGPGARGVTMRANGGAMALEAAGGLVLPTAVTSDSDQNATVTHLRLSNQNAGGSAITRFSLGNSADVADFRIDLNGAGNVNGPGARGVDIRANGGALRLQGGSIEVVIGGSIFRVSAVHTQTTPTPPNVAVDSLGELRRNSSARKYKREIADYTRGLADLQALRPVTFTSIDPGDDNTYAGFIAEEVHDAGLTEFVYYLDGQPDALHYSYMISLAVAAIKDLAGQVATLETERGEQATRLSDLEARVTALETP